ncbi:hypothetical protein E2C01_084512 [Portunus trituberculatus]|uniref:Uncharacterized protein n=1 Tax=Portunus trituberculatus TaxID=210409 RepID=A0A5B7J9G6_PORTR|nr:hypothetical protein [Portunus trituberculatus]
MPSPASRFLRLTLSNLQPNFALIHSVPAGGVEDACPHALAHQREGSLRMAENKDGGGGEQ